MPQLLLLQLLLGLLVLLFGGFAPFAAGGLQMLGGLLRLLGDLLLLQSLRGPLLLLLGGLLLGCLRSHTLACACLPARLAFVHPLWPQVHEGLALRS